MDKIQRTATVDKIVADLVYELLDSSTKVHIAHFSTTSYSAHKALNKYYDEIIELADTLAESYQGIVGKILPYPDNSSVPVLKSPEEVVYYIKNLCERITTLQVQIPYSQVNNLLDEVKTLINSTTYKLTFLK